MTEEVREANGEPDDVDEPAGKRTVTPIIAASACNGVMALAEAARGAVEVAGLRSLKAATCLRR